MSVTATSPIAQACQGAIDVIANSSIFQTRVSTHHASTTNDSAGALKHIYGYEAWERGEASLDSMRPFAAVIDGESFYTRIGICDQSNFRANGSVVVVISDIARYTDAHGDSPTDDWNDSWIDFLNFCDGVCNEVAGDFGGPKIDPNETFWPFREIQTLEVPTRTPVKTRRVGQRKYDWWEVAYGWTWGEDE